MILNIGSQWTERFEFEEDPFTKGDPIPLDQYLKSLPQDQQDAYQKAYLEQVRTLEAQRRQSGATAQPEAPPLQE